MTKRKITLIFVIFMFVLTGIRLVWLQLQHSPAHANAVNGQLDLRSWDWAQSPRLTLNGEWVFHPYQLIEPKANVALEAGDAVFNSKLIKLPSDWKGELSEDNNSAYGYASYHLRIAVEPNKERLYKVRIPAIPAASSLFINGELLARSGQPAESAEHYETGNVPYSATFSSKDGVVDIVIHVANYDDRIMSGIMQPVKLGTKEAMDISYFISAGAQLAVCLLLFMHFIYAVILYFIGARQRAFISFSLMILSAIITILIDDERILSDWFSVNYEWTWKLYYLSFLGVAVFVLHYTINLLEKVALRRFVRWYTVICAIYALVVLLLPARILGYFELLHALLVILPFFIVPILSVLAIRKGNSDMIFILLGVSAITVNVIWGVIKNSGVIESGYYPIDTTAAFVCFALYWFKRYFRSSDVTAKLTERLKAEDKRKDEFLVNTSHELRNPLHGMLSIAQSVMESGTRYDEEGNQARMKLLVLVGKRMSYMLNDLMDLTRFKENRIRLQQTSVQLQTVSAGVLDMLRYMTEGKPIRLINHVPGDLPAIFADENRLIQILLNLLHNAVKFTREGEISIHAASRDGDIHISISDTGIGMDEETIKKIFEPYEQGDVEMTGSVTGLGLGLAISKQLVDMHQGTLIVQSTIGVGSTFSFNLPIADHVSSEHVVRADNDSVVPIVLSELHESLGSVAAGSLSSELNSFSSEGEGFEIGPLSMVSQNRPRILAIDDDPVNLTVLKSILNEVKYDIVTATSGEEAIPLLESGIWDLIITDVMMPQMSGYEVTHAVREQYSRSELPILLLTARSRMEDIEAGFRFGANDYISKPVDAMELRSRVRALTEITKAAREQARMEAAWLQAQIEPHFLFNTLGAIAALSEIDIDRMRNLLTVFGDYLRASFDFHNADQLIPITKELELVRAYLTIERERFEERVRVEWEVDEDSLLLIPPLSIQPLVENAVRHGLLQRSKGGTVWISVVHFGNYAKISVRDDGIGMDEKSLSGLLTHRKSNGSKRRGVGVANTDYRLKQLFGSGLCIESTIGEGTTVSFVVTK
ncbi:response regulator [Paenibacillus sp. GSMTC-2017]|uniref:hybrid sensor histidine kinase/response regulator n=1 Tax=Paenibacillus sp. GSMTC-2017 TaxID=2794350 RepID=UPI0018D9F330|nr:ATP-binding protein [Paenibacillus sp. GSMTC-2017]MBH5319685.1 response regulator [Paenibacillus sp. GSMTC-2017]